MIVMEYCDAGTLKDVLRRGCFRRGVEPNGWPRLDLAVRGREEGGGSRGRGEQREGGAEGGARSAAAPHHPQCPGL